MLDTGIDIKNKNLRSNIFTNKKEIAHNYKDDDNNGFIDDVNGWNFVNHNPSVYDNATEDQHGTNVAGVIAAAAGNNGIIGVAPKAKILPLKFMTNKTGYTSDAIDAIEYAKSMGVKIMNISWGCQEFNYALKAEMSSANMLFVCAAGNEGKGAVAYPAAFDLPNVISVGSIDNQGNATSYTSSGISCDLFAPGDHILTTNCGNGYTTVSGTSFSAAFVTGIAALVKQEVPSITTDELKLAVENGYTEKGNKKIKVADANNAIKNALTIKCLDDKTGKLSRIMKYSGKLFSQEICYLFTRYSQWNSIDDNDRNTICSFFNIPNSEFEKCNARGINLIDSVTVELSAKRVELDTETILSLLNTYNDINKFDTELENLRDLMNRIQLSDNKKSELIDLMKKGYTVNQIASALIVSEALNISLSNIISPLGKPCSFNDQVYPNDEKALLTLMVQKYHVRGDVILSKLNDEKWQPSQLYQKIYKWQEANNFYIIDNKVTAFSADIQSENGFSKYKISTGNSWDVENASIDKTDGVLTYSQPLLSLTGRNGLNLNLGLRFDSNVADAKINANDPSLLKYNFRASLQNTAGNSDLNIFNFADSSLIGFWTRQSNSANNITITAGIDNQSSSLTANNLSNYNNRRYGLGIGWAWDFPSIEMTGTQMYLHLPGGSKYLLVNNNGTYSIEGYKLQDAAFSIATGSDFTVNNVVANYMLLAKNGSKEFFAADGRYLGKKDIMGNAIQVFYNTDGTFDKIYDTAGRIIKFNYIVSSDLTTKTISIQLIDNTAANSQTNTVYTITENLDSATGAYELTKIKDAMGRESQLDYGNYDSSIIFNYRSDLNSATEVKNKAIYLQQVIAPTGAETVFDYSITWEQYGFASDRSYQRLSDIYEKKSATDPNQYNKSTYSYFINDNGALTANDNTYWMYEQNMIYPYRSNVSGESIQTIEGEKQSFCFDRNGLETSSTVSDVSGSIEKNKTTDTVISRDQYDQPTEVQEKIFNNNGTDYTLKQNDYTWDQYGNELSSQMSSGSNTEPNSRIDEKAFYTYGASSNSIPLTEVEYKNDNSGDQYGIQYDNTINANTQEITETDKNVYDLSTNQKESSVTSEQFAYNSYGNLTDDKVIDNTDNNMIDKLTVNTVNKTIETVYAYDSQYSIYPVVKTIKNVKDADGNYVKKADGTSSSDITTSVRYNIFGEKIASVDGNGFETDYSYDPIGNLIKTVNPNGTAISVDYDYPNHTVTTTNVDGTATKTVTDEFGNVLNTSSKNSDGIHFDLITAIPFKKAKSLIHETNP